MRIALGIYEQEDFHRPEISVKKTLEIGNEARISKKPKIKRKFNRNQKRITPWDIQLSCLTSLFIHTQSNIKMPYVRSSRQEVFCKKPVLKALLETYNFCYNSSYRGTTMDSKCVSWLNIFYNFWFALSIISL